MRRITTRAAWRTVWRRSESDGKFTRRLKILDYNQKMIFESESLRADATPPHSGLVIVNAHLSATPHPRIIDSFGDAVRKHIERDGTNVFLLHIKHVRSPSLQNLSIESILQLGKLLVEVKGAASRIKQVVMECRNVDAAASATAAVFSSVVKIPLVMTASSDEAQEAIDRLKRRCVQKRP